mgnify:CR=1 FL=1
MKPEALFSARIRAGLLGCDIERIENRVNLGISDMLIGIEDQFVMVENKVVTKGYKVALRPHQIAFLTRHALRGRPSYVLVLWKASGARPDTILLYHGRQAIELAEQGLRLRPVAQWLSRGIDWQEVKKELLRNLGN